MKNSTTTITTMASASNGNDNNASQTTTTSLLPTPAQAEKYKNFKKLHDEAFRLIENGIELEQAGHKQDVCMIIVFYHAYTWSTNILFTIIFSWINTP